MLTNKRIVLSSTHTDSHGDQMSLQALQQMAEIINGEIKVRHGVDHNREFPPIGRLGNAEIVEKEGAFYLTAVHVPYDKIENVDWDKDLVFESFNDPAPFTEVKRDATEIFTVGLDPNNFESIEKYNEFVKNLNYQNDIDFKLESIMRKAVLSDPEVIITLTKSVFLYHLIKPTLEKIGDKIADKIADKTIDKSKEFYKFIKKTITQTVHYCIPKARPIMIVFEVTGEPHIELIAKTRDEEFVLNALKDKKLIKVQNEIESLSKKFEIDKVQFILTDKGKWKFNYLLTKKGESLGRRTTIKKRDRRMEVITSGNSKQLKPS